ncbi:MAG: hypothetical protein HN576_16485 [Bacteriovoracaceae bacterium]|jgi:perosamine synthetase|nr:hypothetical protein [Bacteriovoracaceae bacterium]
MINSFRQSLVSHFTLKNNIPEVSLFGKARIAEYALLKSIGIKPGDEVIISAFTCVSVVNPIVYLGAKPIYVDIDLQTFTMDIDLLKKKITDKTKVIIIQNTYGYPTPIWPLLESIKDKNIILIDDASHGFQDYSKIEAILNSPFYVFFSMHWMKNISAGAGGAVVCYNSSFASDLKILENKYNCQNLLGNIFLRLYMFIWKNLMRNWNYWFFFKAHSLFENNSFFSKYFPGEHIDEKTNIREIPDNYLKSMSPLQAKYGQYALSHLEETLEIRRAIVKRYDDIFIKLNLPILTRPADQTHYFLKYCFRVKNNDSFVKKAQLINLELNRWPYSPLTPVKNNYERWGFNQTENKNAVEACKTIINLPTNPDIGDSYFIKLEKFLSINKSDIIF